MIIVEHIKDSCVHLDVNAAMIAISMLSTNETIHLFCGKAHYEEITKYYNAHNIDYSKLVFHEIKPFHDYVRDYKLIKFDYNIASKIFKYAKENNETNVLFLYTSTFLLYYIKWFMLYNRKIKVMTALHSELERIAPLEYAKSFQGNHIVYFLYAIFFGVLIPLLLPTSNRLKYIVYGYSIKENAVKKIPKLKKYIIPIPDPFIYTQKAEKEVPNGDNITFGILGITAKRKNTPILYKVFDFIKEKEYKNCKVAFAGKIIDNEFLEYAKTFDFVNREELSDKLISVEMKDNIIKRMNYALYAYPYNSYKLLASGAFMDIIENEIPILAIKNDYIKHYFDQYGNIGYLCESVEELESKIDDILLGKTKDEYKIQVENLRKIKEAESISITSNIFKREFSDAV